MWHITARALSRLTSCPPEPLRPIFELQKRAQQEDLSALQFLHILESQVLPDKNLNPDCDTNTEA